MMMLFSASEMGFFQSSQPSVPDDAIEINDGAYQAIIEGLSSGRLLGVDESGNPVLIERSPLAIEDLATSKRMEVEAALDAELAAGMSYTFPNGEEDVVQMRIEDRQNLLSLAIEARDLQSAGITAPVQEFRAQSNTRYPMTPAEMITMTDAALGHYKALMQKSWSRKDAIDIALEYEDREAIATLEW